MRAVLPLLILSGCELFLDDRFPPAVDTVITVTEPLPMACHSAPPIADLARLPDGSLTAVVHGQGVVSTDGGRSWTKTLGINLNADGEQGRAGPILTAGEVRVLSSGAQVFIRRQEAWLSIDGGALWVEQPIVTSGGGFTVPTGAAERHVDMGEGVAFAFRRGIWWLTEGDGAWEPVFVDSFVLEGSSELAQVRDRVGDDILINWVSNGTLSDLWVLQDGGDPIQVQITQSGGELSPTLSRLLDDSRIVSVYDEMRVHDIRTQTSVAVPIPGGAFAPHALVRLEEGQFLASGTGEDGRVRWVLLDPEALSVRLLEPDAARPDLSFTLVDAVPSEDGWVVAAQIPPTDGVRGTVLCHAGEGVAEPDVETLIEGVPHDLAPGEMVIHALTEETVQAQTGGFLVSQAYQPTWIQSGLVYVGGPGSDWLPIDHDAIDHGVDYGIARGLSDRFGGTGVVYLWDPNRPSTLQSSWDRHGTGEALGGTDRWITEERRFGGRAQYITANVGYPSFVGAADEGRMQVVGMGIDGLYTDGIDRQRFPGLAQVDTAFWVDGTSDFLPGAPLLPEDRCEGGDPAEDCYILQGMTIEDIEADPHGNVYVLDHYRGVVFMNAPDWPGDRWDVVAEGFIYPVDMQLREQDGRTLLFVRDSVVYAFVVEPGTVARWTP